MSHHRKAFGPHRRSSRQALARDIAASIVAARQRGEQRPITRYTQDEETIRLVEAQLAAAARKHQRAPEGARCLTANAAREMRLRKYGRFWGLYDADGTLICVTVYKKGALEVVRRLQQRHNG
jgi:hypothetical protein